MSVESATGMEAAMNTQNHLDSAEARMRIAGDGHLCEVEGCERGAPRTTFCDMHRKRISRTGELGPPGPMFVPARGRDCGVPECGRRHHGHGLCFMHLQRERRQAAREQVAE